MATVILKDGDNLEAAIKRFKRKVENDGILKEYRERQYFMKPSMKKRLKNKEAIRKYKQKEKKRFQKLESSNRR